MPLLVDPEHDRGRLSLRKHEKRFPDPKLRPTFIVRNMSNRERSAYYARLDEVSNLPVSKENNERYAAVVKDLLTKYVVGWRNVDDTDGKPATFSIDNLIALSRGPELNELIDRLPYALDLDEDTVGESPSPASTAGAGSAAPAAAGDATQQANPANALPSS